MYFTSAANQDWIEGGSILGYLLCLTGKFVNIGMLQHFITANELIAGNTRSSIGF